MARINVYPAQQAGVRIIIQGWDEPLKALSLPETVYHAGLIPTDWLLRQAAGMVHHGGFGTSATAFRAGIPVLVIPILSTSSSGDKELLSWVSGRSRYREKS